LDKLGEVELEIGLFDDNGDNSFGDELGDEGLDLSAT